MTVASRRHRSSASESGEPRSRPRPGIIAGMSPLPPRQSDEASAVPSPSEQIEALGALYSAERSNATNLGNERLALLALQITYLGLAVIALGSDSLPGGAWGAAFAAFPLWFIHSYHLVLVALSIVRTRSVNLLEQAIYDRTGLSADQRALIGNRAGEMVHDVAYQPPLLKLQATAAYGGIGAVMVVFTGYALVVAAQESGWREAPVLLAGTLYACLFVAISLSWRFVGRIAR